METSNQVMQQADCERQEEPKNDEEASLASSSSVDHQACPSPGECNEKDAQNSEKQDMMAKAEVLLPPTTTAHADGDDHEETSNNNAVVGPQPPETSHVATIMFDVWRQEIQRLAPRVRRLLFFLLQQCLSCCAYGMLMMMGYSMGSNVAKILDNKASARLVLLYPHTSRWDAVLMVLVSLACPGRFCFSVVDKYLAIPIVGRILLWAGAISVPNGGGGAPLPPALPPAPPRPGTTHQEEDAPAAATTTATSEAAEAAACAPHADEAEPVESSVDSTACKQQGPTTAGREGQKTCQRIADYLLAHPECVFLVSPEGSLEARLWRSGFLTIARMTGRAVSIAGIDYSRHHMDMIDDPVTLQRAQEEARFRGRGNDPLQAEDRQSIMADLQRRFAESRFQPLHPLCSNPRIQTRGFRRAVSLCNWGFLASMCNILFLRTTVTDCLVHLLILALSWYDSKYAGVVQESAPTLSSTQNESESERPSRPENIGQMTTPQAAATIAAAALDIMTFRRAATAAAEPWWAPFAHTWAGLQQSVTSILFCPDTNTTSSQQQQQQQQQQQTEELSPPKTTLATLCPPLWFGIASLLKVTMHPTITSSLPSLALQASSATTMSSLWRQLGTRYENVLALFLFALMEINVCTHLWTLCVSIFTVPLWQNRLLWKLFCLIYIVADTKRYISHRWPNTSLRVGL